MDLVLWFLGLLAFVWLLVVPAFAWAIFSEDATPRFHVLDPSRHAAPPEVTAFIRDNLASLTPEGFQLVGDMIRVRETLPGWVMRHHTPRFRDPRRYWAGFRLSIRAAILQHPDGVVSTVAVLLSQGTAATIIDFTAELSDGRVLAVTNVNAPVTLVERQGHVTYHLPEVRDPLRLYRIFRLLLRRRFGAATLRRREVLADPSRFLADLHDEMLHGKVEAGYLRLDRKANRYQATLKAAYLWSWRVLPPFAQLRRVAARRKARALLREIGMEGEDQRPVAAPSTVTQVEPPAVTDVESPEPAESRQRGTDWPGILLWVGFVLLIGGLVVITRFISGFASLVVFLGGLLLLLWLSQRRHGRGRLVAPFGVWAAMVVGVAGFREYQASRPIDRASLVVPADFPSAVRALEKVARTTARPLVIRGDTTPGFYVTVRAARALALLDSTIVEQFHDQGFSLFRWLRSGGERRRLDRVGLYPSPDKYVVLQAMRTGGAGVGPDAIVAWFQELEHDYRLTLTTIGPNNVEGRIAVDSAEALDVARRLSNFCLDLELGRDVTTAERAAALVSHGGYFQCWWERGGSAR